MMFIKKILSTQLEELQKHDSCSGVKQIVKTFLILQRDAV